MISSGHQEVGHKEWTGARAGRGGRHLLLGFPLVVPLKIVMVVKMFLVLLYFASTTSPDVEQLQLHVVHGRRLVLKKHTTKIQLNEQTKMAQMNKQTRTRIHPLFLAASGLAGWLSYRGDWVDHGRPSLRPPFPLLSRDQDSPEWKAWRERVETSERQEQVC